MVNIALVDLLISTLVVPVIAVSILAKTIQDVDICHFQWFLLYLCCFVAILTHAVMAVENLVELANKVCYDFVFSVHSMLLVLIFIWLIAGSIVTVQFMYKIGPDYCKMIFKGDLHFHLSTSSSMIFAPLVLCMYCYFRIYQIVRHAKKHPYRLPLTFDQDVSMAQTTFNGLIFFCFCWTPFILLMVVGAEKKIPPQVFDIFAWFPRFSSCFSCFTYAASNKYFRETYVNLFHYCFCKTSVTFSRRGRQVNTRAPNKDLRVHIIPGFSTRSTNLVQNCAVNRSARVDTYMMKGNRLTAYNLKNPNYNVYNL